MFSEGMNFYVMPKYYETHCHICTAPITATFDRIALHFTNEGVVCRGTGRALADNVDAWQEDLGEVLTVLRDVMHGRTKR